MNRITFTGRIVADAELRFVPDGTAVSNFRVASDVGFGDKKVTNWLNCQVWGKRAKSIKPLLIKGQQLTCFGSLTLREWTDRDGIKKVSPDIRIDDIELMGGKQTQANNSPTDQPRKESDFSDIDDQIPF